MTILLKEHGNKCCISCAFGLSRRNQCQIILIHYDFYWKLLLVFRVICQILTDNTMSFNAIADCSWRDRVVFRDFTSDFCLLAFARCIDGPCSFVLNHISKCEDQMMRYQPCFLFNHLLVFSMFLGNISFEKWLTHNLFD